MTKKTKLIDEKLATQASEELAKLNDIGIVAIRLKAIIAAFKYGIKIVSEVFDINRSSLHRWVALYKNGGCDALKNIKKPPRSKFDQQNQEIIKSWIEHDANLTIKKLGIMIEEKLNISASKSSIHRLLMKLGFSHITGRTKHYKANESAQAEFKKKSSSKASR